MYRVGCYLALLLTVCTQQQANNATAMFIPHTHDDPGWLMSFENYYNYYVRAILNNIVTYLDKNPDFKFVWCESSFLHRWWGETSVENKDKFKQQVSQGRIEIVGGGWVMHDEATPDFRDMIEQMDIGLTFVNNILGVKPDTIWQIDPFGHGSTTAALAFKLGYTSIMLNRISTVEKEKLREQNCDFYWEGNPTGKPREESQFIFTHVLYDHYCQDQTFRSDGFCFSDYTNCVRKFFDMFILRSINHTMTPVIPLLFGDDFTYSVYNMFEKGHSLVKYFYSSDYPTQKGYNLTTKIATYKEYIETLQNYGQTYGTFRGDFFPYAQNIGNLMDYWTGYFTTRPCLKQLTDEMMRQVRVANMLLLLTNIIILNKKSDIDLKEITDLLVSSARNSSILLHHDAITGTHALQTYNDYMNIINASIAPLKNISSKLINYLLTLGKEHMQSYNIKEQNISKAYSVYNPSAIYRKELIVINVTTKYAKIKRYNGRIIDECQLNQYFESDNQIVCEIGIDAYSIETVYLNLYETDQPCNDECVNIASQTEYTDISDELKIIIENDMYTVSIHPYTNFINWIYDKSLHKIVSISEGMVYYHAHSTRSGPYIFNPTTNATRKPGSIVALLQHGKLGYFVRICNNYTRNERFVITFALLNGSSKFIYANYDYMDNIEGEVVMQMNFTGMDQKLSSTYLSDSMNYIKREYRDINEASQKKYAFVNQKSEFIGYNTYPSVDGFVLHENLKSQSFFFGLSHSHVVGLVLYNITDYGILLTRSVQHNDNKGVGDAVIDLQPSSFHTEIFTANTLEEFMDLKSIAYQSIHNPFEVIPIRTEEAAKFTIFSFDFPKEVELVGTKILSNDNNGLEFLIRIRNSYPFSQKIKVGNIFRDIKTTFIGKYSLTGYEKEEDLYIRNKNMKAKLKIDESRKVLKDVRKDFILLEELNEVKEAELIPNKDEVVLSGFELTALRFKI